MRVCRAAIAAESATTQKSTSAGSAGAETVRIAPAEERPQPSSERSEQAPWPLMQVPRLTTHDIEQMRNEVMGELLDAHGIRREQLCELFADLQAETKSLGVCDEEQCAQLERELQQQLEALDADLLWAVEHEVPKVVAQKVDAHYEGWAAQLRRFWRSCWRRRRKQMKQQERALKALRDRDMALVREMKRLARREQLAGRRRVRDTVEEVPSGWAHVQRARVSPACRGRVSRKPVLGLMALLLLAWHASVMGSPPPYQPPAQMPAPQVMSSNPHVPLVWQAMDNLSILVRPPQSLRSALSTEGSRSGGRSPAGGAATVQNAPPEQRGRPPDGPAVPPAEVSGSPPRATTPHGARHPGKDARFVKHAEGGYTWCDRADLQPALRDQLHQLMHENDTVFARSLKQLGCYRGELGPATIALVHDRPIFEAPRRHSQRELEIQDAKCKELLDAGIIRPSNSTKYALNSTMPAKKDADGNWTDTRYCCDARPLNAATIPDKYRPPVPEELFERIGTARWLSKCDCRAAFNQIPLRAEDQEKTSFWWRGKLYCYTRNLYGLRNATAIFQRVMDHHIRQAGLDYCCVVFVDDLVVFSQTAEDHVRDLARVVAMLQSINLKLHPDKTVLCADVVEFLGHMVSADGLRPMEAKVAAIRALKAPTNATELLSILGIMNYYRCYLPRYSEMANPLIALTRKGVVWDSTTWQPQHQAALDLLKEQFSREGLVLKRVHPDRPLILHTDFSAAGISGVLGQLDEDGHEYMCACVSRSLNMHERNYPSYKGELLAVTFSIVTLRPYLHGVHFTLVTDHAPLLWLMENQNLQGQYARWALILQEYDFDVAHRPGTLHQNADALSRSPLPDSSDGTGARLDEDSDPVPPKPKLVGYQPPAKPTALSEISEVLAAKARERANELHTVTALTTVSPVPSQLELLSGHVGRLPDVTESPPGRDPDTQGEADIRVLRQAARLVRDHRPQLRACALEAARPQYFREGPGGALGTMALSTRLASHHFIDRAHSEGLVVVEYGSGLAAGLEACLRAGWKVRRYLVTGVGPEVQPALQHRLQYLRGAHPDLLLHKAIANPLRGLPLTGPISDESLRAIGATNGDQWLVIARAWDDPAGSTRLLDFIGALQRLQPRLGPGYVVESSVYDTAATAFGNGFALDLAQFGRAQHARTTFWTNLADAAHLRVLVQAHAKEAEPCPLQQCAPARALPIAAAPDSPALFVSNIPGQPLRTLHEGDLLQLQLPMISDPWGPSTPLTVAELGAVIGLGGRGIATSSVPEPVARIALASSVDVRTIQHLFAFSHALQRAFVTPHHMATLHPKPTEEPPALQLGGVAPEPSDGREAGGPAACIALATAGQISLRAATSHLALVAEVAERGQPTGSHDIWEDAPTLHYVQHRQAPPGLSEAEQRRVQRRATSYRRTGGQLYRLMPDGTQRLVPHPQQRRQLIQQVHAQLGHFGARRTLALIQHDHWWSGMAKDVERVVEECKLCGQANIAGNVRPEQLQPLPIMGPFYRWGVDLCGPFPQTPRDARYVMVAIEHFTKHVELVPLPNKTAAATAQAFLSHVLARFSAPAEVLTDGGQEWDGVFADLLEQCFIDHRRTSPNHPQADGAAERVVQVVKRGLRKACAGRGQPDQWDLDLPWLALGYRCSPQASTRLSPYQLLYGQPPVIPPAVRERLAEPLDFDDPAKAWELVEQRAKLLQRQIPAAGGNLLIAQHRDTLRYAKVRSGAYYPRLHRIQPGDYVYVMRKKEGDSLRGQLSTLQLPTKEEVLRVRSISKQGVATLIGRCGSERRENVSNLAPCHLPNLDPIIDPRLAVPSTELCCEVCGFPHAESRMLLCDGCGTGWHTYCLQPPLKDVPPGTWVCPDCMQAGVTKEQIEARPLEPRGRRAPVFQTAAQRRRRQQRAASLVGTVVEQLVRDGAVGLMRPRRGVVAGPGQPDDTQTRVVYEDSTIEDLAFPQLAPCIRADIPGAVTLATRAERLPDRWDLTTGEGVTRALSYLYADVPLDREHVAWLTSSLAALRRTVHPGAIPKPALRRDSLLGLERDLERLLARLELDKHVTVLDPWSTGGGVGKLMGRRGFLVTCNDPLFEWEAERHDNPLQPAFFRGAQRSGAMDVVVSEPPQQVIDLLAPLATMFADVTAWRLPYKVITEAPLPRRLWLDRMSRRGRLVMIPGVEDPVRGQWVWMVLFRTRELKQRLLWVGSDDYAPWVLS